VAGGGADSSLEADRFEICGDMLGSAPALIFERRICRNRSDPQQGEQSFYTLVDIMIDAAQNRVEGLHEELLYGQEAEANNADPS
jgi:hypothetical protein